MIASRGVYRREPLQLGLLHERRLSLSRKKSRMGCIKRGFHFLGIDYLPTRTEDTTNMTHMNDDSITIPNNAHYLSENVGGGKTPSGHQKCEAIRMDPHPRTLRKAREQVKCIVIDGSSAYRIRNYLHRWTMWWTNSSSAWEYQELLQHFINASGDGQATAYATALSCLQQLKLLHTGSPAELGLAA